MHIQKVLPKAMIPMTMATMLFIGAQRVNASSQGDSFQKFEPKTENVDSKNAEKSDSKVPWSVHIISIGAIATFLGIMKLADYIDKKEQKEESQKQQDISDNV